MINWFEIPVTDFDRAKKFYETIFDCKIETQEIRGFLVGFFPSYEGKVISGAIVKGEGYVPSMNGAIIYFNGDPDLSEALNIVESAGGKVVIPKTQIVPEYGYFAICVDTEGNKIALHSTW